MRIGIWVLLALFGGYVALKYYNVKVEVGRSVRNQYIAPAGVNYYCCQPVVQRPQQIWAFNQQNCCSTNPIGYAPAFGPQENQPQSIASLCI